VAPDPAPVVGGLDPTAEVGAEGLSVVGAVVGATVVEVEVDASVRRGTVDSVGRLLVERAPPP
jgi:hypothetical protein